MPLELNTDWAYNGLRVITIENTFQIARVSKTIASPLLLSASFLVAQIVTIARAIVFVHERVTARQVARVVLALTAAILLSMQPAGAQLSPPASQGKRMKAITRVPLLAPASAFALSLQDAYVQETDDATWKLGNAKIELEIAYTGSDLLLTRLHNRAKATDWTPAAQASIAQLIDFRWRGKEYRELVPGPNSDFQLTAHKITRDENSVLLALVFTTRSSEPKLEFSLFYRVYPNSFIETWSELEHLDSGTEPPVEALQVGRFWLPMSGTGWAVADTSVYQYGERARVRWATLAPAASMDIPLIGTPRRGPGADPGMHGYLRSFVVRRGVSESLIGGVLYGHRAPVGFGYPGPLRLSRGADGKSAVAELLDTSAASGEHRETLNIGSHQSVKGLTFILSFSGGDLASVSTDYQQFARNYLMLPPPTGSGELPWIEFNPYFAYDLGWDVTQLRKDADIAADLGVEVFVVDAGWWAGSLKKSERVTSFSDYLVGAGTYTPDSSVRFPVGGMSFLEFSDYVHSKGMKFGLWLCPFNVDPRHNTGWDPAWLDGNSNYLCSSHKPAFDWVKNHTDQLVDTYHLDYLKFDCNAPQKCANALCDNIRQPGAKKYVITAHQGYDDLVAALRLSHPAVAMEDDLLVGHVSSGADDFDLSPDAGRTALEKDRFTEPPRYTGLYLMHEPIREPGMDEKHYRAYVDYIVRSYIMGVITISSDLSKWSPSFRAVVKSQLQLYRENRRVLNGLTQELAFDRGWDAVQFRDPESGAAMVFAFRKKGGTPNRRFLLHGLEPQRSYTVTFADRKTSLQLTGNEMMTKGIAIALPLAPASEIVFIR